MQWSKYQEAIFKDVKSGTGNTLIVARAGCGKTQTIVESLKYVPSGKKILLLAFNRSIFLELKEKVPSYVECSTLHSLGYKALNKAFGNIILDTNKVFKICCSLVKKKFSKLNYDIVIALTRTISLCKNYLYDTPDKISEIIDKFQIYISPQINEKDFISLVLQGLKASKSKKNIIDYDDMVYHPFVYNIPLEKHDYIFCDETQDFCPAQIALTLNSLDKNGRIFCCLDYQQLLYSFRGVDRYAIENLGTTLKAKTLKLPVSYRCAKNIVRMAQSYVPDYKYYDNSPDGEIIRIKEKDILGNVKPGDFIISRINAPLVKLCITLLENKIPANIKGKNIGENLIAITNLYGSGKDILKFIGWLVEWKKAEINKCIKTGKSYQHIADFYECLVYLATKCNNTTKLLKLLKDIFKNDDDYIEQVKLMTVHYSKGLEAKNCFILMNTMLPDTDWSEKNIRYVAITRAKNKLFLVS